MGNRNRNPEPKAWRTTIVTAASLAFFGVSVAAFADTYNFYFTKGKKKAAPTESGSSAETADAASETLTDEPALETSEAKRRERGGDRPIIINNNIHGVPSEENRRFTPPDSSSFAPEDDPENRPPAKPIGSSRLSPRPSAPPSTPPSETTVTASVKAPADDYSHFRFAISAVAWDAKGWNNDIGNVSHGEPGIIATLGIDFTRALALNIYGGTVRERWLGNNGNNVAQEMRFMGGAEFQVTPFRLNVGSFDLLELGFVVGSSTLGQSDIQSFVDPKQIHLGARFNINFGKSFGLTNAFRVNGRYTLLEAGLVARL